MNLGEILAASAAKAPDRIALSCGDELLTYAELDAQATRLAHGLRSACIEHGDRVALHMGNTIEMALCYFACFKLGAIAVPLNIRLKPAEIEYILEHSEARMYIGEPGLYERPAGTPDSRTQDRLYLTTNGDPRGAFAAFRDLFRAPSERPLPQVRGADPAAILYTSGTTARPKGVTHSNDSLRHSAESAVATTPVAERDGIVALLYSPLSHAGGLITQLLPAVLLAAECALVPRFEPRAVLETLERRRCTGVFGLPASLQALCREQAAHPVDVSSLRRCGAGGDAVSMTLQNEFRDLFGVAIREGIGMTEAVPLCCNMHGRIRAGSVGEPAAGVTARVVDEHGQTVPPGVAGELVVRFAGMMIGYWNDPAATAAAIRDGWLHTGDLVRRDEDGYYWFAGRKKEIIIRGGSNVSPQEVEEVLLQHPAVFQAGVVGMPDAELGESVIAFVKLRDGRSCREPELIDFASRFLSDHKVPGKVHFLPVMPLGITGKVSRRALKESLVPLDGEAGDVGARAVGARRSVAANAPHDASPPVGLRAPTAP